MIQFPNRTVFASTLHDGRFIAAVVVAALAGVVRGFSGFGSALIYVPLIAALYEPRIATVSFVLMDYVCVAPYVVRALRRTQWRQVAPALVASLLTVPLGTMLQSAADPVPLRWGMTAFVLLFVALLASGWRYPFKPTTLAAACTGALSGFCGGAMQMSGPPAILYWLGSRNDATVIRSNLLVFLVTLGLMLLVSYTWHGLLTAKPIALAILLWPTYIVALAIGARWFSRASDRRYRQIAYFIVAGAALVSMPVFDRLLH